jgi:hypothetical protein
VHPTATASIQVATLFVSCAAYDNTTAGQSVMASSIAAFHYRSTPNPADIAAAMGVPGSEVDGVMVTLRNALSECERVRDGGSRLGPASLPALPLRVEGGYFVDRNGATVYPASFSQQPDISESNHDQVGCPYECLDVCHCPHVCVGAARPGGRCMAACACEWTTEYELTLGYTCIDVDSAI